MKFLRTFMFSLLPLVSSLLLSSTAQSQNGWSVTYEGNFVSGTPFTGYGIQEYNVYDGIRPITTLDLATNNLGWTFQEGKDVAVEGLYTFFESDGNFRLIVRDVKPIQFLKGTLENAFGIGGETTGYALRLENGRTVEIDLRTNSLSREFALGRAVQIRGYYIVVQGVQTRRSVLLVSQVKPVL